MSMLAWIVVACLLSGAASVLLAATVLALPSRLRADLVPHLVSFAVGSLLGAAFLALLPHALESQAPAGVHAISGTVLGGVLVFFLLEKMVLWRHCHTDKCEAHQAPEESRPAKTPGALLVIGDAFHNFIDGVLIGAAFLSDLHLGIVTAFAVAAHEIPQEVGEFAVLLHSGFSRVAAFWFNILSSLTAVLGGVMAYFALAGVLQLVPYVLAIAAASFVYIAIADLIPGLHRRPQIGATVQQLILIGCGIAVIALAHSALH